MNGGSPAEVRRAGVDVPACMWYCAGAGDGGAASGSAIRSIERSEDIWSDWLEPDGRLDLISIPLNKLSNSTPSRSAIGSRLYHTNCKSSHRPKS